MEELPYANDEVTHQILNVDSPNEIIVLHAANRESNKKRHDNNPRCANPVKSDICGNLSQLLLKRCFMLLNFHQFLNPSDAAVRSDHKHDEEPLSS